MMGMCKYLGEAQRAWSNRSLDSGAGAGRTKIAVRVAAGVVAPIGPDGVARLTTAITPMI